MGCVYRAHDLSLDRTVALKVLPTDLNEPMLIARFKREARAQARLSHPNVVPIYFIGEQAGRHFFAMELVEGYSLDEALTEHERIDWQRALEYMIDVSKALRQAHERDLIHRDLKPGNLLVTPEGHVKVADFGLAKPIEEGDSALTQEGSFMGTPMYIAPEQAQGESVDHRADMYALGATFFHLLAGHPVFSAPTPMAMVVKHVSEKPPPIEEIVDDLPPKLSRILGRLLEKKPQDRFSDYDALLEALEDARPRRQPEAGFLVRATAWTLDVALIVASAIVYEYLPLIIYPIYFMAAWTTGWGTLGQWLFRLRVQRDDDAPLSAFGSLKRFAAMHWGMGVTALIIAIMHFGFGINEIDIKAGEVTTPGDPVLQIVIASAIGVVLVIWLLGAMVSAVHPRKRALHDLLTGTKVIYKLDSD
jgi:uncharacterized RDD family membrane protein YckC